MARNKKTEPKQKEFIGVMVISLLLGLGGGYAIGTGTSDNHVITMNSNKSHNHNDENMQKHSLFEVPSDQAPTVQLEVVEDAKSGYNVRIVTSNFTFTPEKVNTQNVIGEGHAHLYVDGEKISRLYANNFHYDVSFEGKKTFRVTLNANDHSEYAVNGQKIEATFDMTHNSSDPNHNTMHDKN